LAAGLGLDLLGSLQKFPHTLQTLFLDLGICGMMERERKGWKEEGSRREEWKGREAKGKGKGKGREGTGGKRQRSLAPNVKSKRHLYASTHCH